MFDPTPIAMSSSPALSPDEIANRSFPSARRGLDADAVRRFLEEVAAQARDARGREVELRRALADAERRAAAPVLDEVTLSAALGSETARVLQVAHEAARELVAKAEQRAATVLGDADCVLAEATHAAEAEVADLLADARAEAAALVDAAKEECRVMVDTAREARLRILADLAERRRALAVQLEQLRAGKDSLAGVVDHVARSVDAIRRRLDGAEEEAREVADEAGRFASLGLDDRDLDALVEDALAPPAANGSGDGGSGDGGAGDGASVPAEPAEGRAAALAEPGPEPEPEPEPAGSIGSPAASGAVALAAGLDAVAAGHAERAGVSATGVAGEEPAGPEDAAPPAVETAEATEPAEPAEAIEPVGANGPAGSAEPDGASEPVGGTPSVDELFARIRASRDEEVVRARSVLAAAEPAEDLAVAAEATTALIEDATAASSGTGPLGEALVAKGIGAPAVGEAEEVTGPPVEVDEILALRDALLEPACEELGRALKRSLRLEQNELLDAIRHLGARDDPASILPGDALAARLAEVAGAGLVASWRAGGEFAASRLGLGSLPDLSAPGATEAGDEVARALAAEVVAALRLRIDEGVGTRLRDEVDLAGLVGVAFRAWKGARVDALAGDFATEAFALGTVAVAMSAGAPVYWHPDDGVSQCPDCDDNAIAGAQRVGEEFPTGHVHPPVHPGCRCVLVPERG